MARSRAWASTAARSAAAQDPAIILGKESEHGITHEFQDLAAGLGDRRHDAIEIAVEQLEYMAARQAVGDFRETAQVTEQQCCFQRLDRAPADMAGKNALGCGGTDIGIEQAQFGATQNPQFAGIAQGGQKTAENGMIIFRETPRRGRGKDRRADRAVGIAEWHDVIIDQAAIGKHIHPRPSRLGCRVDTNPDSLLCFHDLLQRAADESSGSEDAVLTVMHLHRLIRCPGNRPPQNLRM